MLGLRQMFKIKEGWSEGGAGGCRCDRVGESGAVQPRGVGDDPAVRAAERPANTSSMRSRLVISVKRSRSRVSRLTLMRSRPASRKSRRSGRPANRRCPAPSLPNAPPIPLCAHRISRHLPASVLARTHFVNLS